MISNIISLTASDNIFKKYLKEAFNNLNMVLSISDSNSKNDNESLEYIVVNDSKYLKSKVLNSIYCFVNMDNTLIKNIDISGVLITYGIGTKNTITLSSLEENNFVYCIQRYLSINSSFVLEPQEIPLSIEIYNETHLYALMVAVTIALIQGMTREEIEKKLSKKYLSI